MWPQLKVYEQALVAEPFSKGGTRARQKLWNIFVVWLGNCDVTNIEM